MFGKKYSGTLFFIEKKLRFERFKSFDESSAMDRINCLATGKYPAFRRCEMKTKAFFWLIFWFEGLILVIFGVKRVIKNLLNLSNLNSFSIKKRVPEYFFPNKTTNPINFP